ncbi:MAG: Lactate utilization protein A [Gammaproteobacteria bacterium]|nr:Lactate utilization protein A [Gammaproteobacteria bacterium]
MQTALPEALLATPDGADADAILRKCVHCGFCTATCPTYQLLGDERDGPRGRIYLVKSLLEGVSDGTATRLHLDRCLGCRACETACPSGVQYGRLLDIGRVHVERQSARPLPSRTVRWLLRRILPRRAWFALAMRAAQRLRPIMPAALRRKVPAHVGLPPWSAPPRARTMIVLRGCVQPALAPSINRAMARVLDALGIQAIEVEEDVCCGALSHHLAAAGEALDFARRNIDAWWPPIEAGAEAILVTASGCGTMVKEYGHLLRLDPAYAEKAARVSAMCRDPVEVLAAEDLGFARSDGDSTIVFHPPCSLQHGLRLGGRTEQLLSQLGYRLSGIRDSHLCCGSAGSYSILQPGIARELRARKLENLMASAPSMIATANIGCMSYLQEISPVPVRHWIELLADALPAALPSTPIVDIDPGAPGAK